MGPPAPGIGIDRNGEPVIDPTKNVMDTFEAGMRRQDDLREAESRALRREMELRAEFDKEIRSGEKERIDAIRAVDVGAVQRAAEVAAQQASVLAATLAQTAESVRAAQAATATQFVDLLNRTVDPIIKDIQDLRKTQAEGVGVRTNTTDNRLGINVLVGVGSLMLVLFFGVTGLLIAQL
jgi:hypothetical protein